MFRMLKLALGAAMFFAPLALAKAPTPATPLETSAATITVFAAASLKNSLDDIAALWKAKTGGEARLSYAASMTLAKQIEGGAPADLFLSADRDSMDYLTGRGLVDTRTRVDLLGNTLVVVAPQSAPVQKLAFEASAFEQALDGGRIALGEPSSVPAGRYAKEAFAALRLWGFVEPRAAYADNVRGALMFVARGEAPLGVVYATDAAMEPKVKTVATFPESTHAPIVYPVALTKSASGSAPQAFLNFLRGPEAGRIFTKYGFKLLPTP
ncbi:MAG TPA: molybdate ABC transporter substrate-binding protein [Methylocystis sp.]|nr:molybdate ABC transporter substrate-binding protein [Methylocystis sp.]